MRKAFLPKLPRLWIFPEHLPVGGIDFNLDKVLLCEGLSFVSGQTHAMFVCGARSAHKKGCPPLRAFVSEFVAYPARENITPQIQLPATAPAGDAILPARAEEPEADSALVTRRGSDPNPVVGDFLVSTRYLVLKSHRDGNAFTLR